RLRRPGTMHPSATSFEGAWSGSATWFAAGRSFLEDRPVARPGFVVQVLSSGRFCVPWVESGKKRLQPGDTAQLSGYSPGI
ncbi:MAG: hypothetical protein HGB35_08740, partial [Geobacteraceae bacterium]|nr:hypothetical protein [Geobacteraceae bacterium]